MKIVIIQSIVLLLSLSIFAQKKIEVNNFYSIQDQGTIAADSTDNVELQAGIRAGYFLPTDEGIQDIYGNGFMYGSDFIIWVNNLFGINVQVDYFGKSGNPIILTSSAIDFEGDLESNISILPITLNLLLRMKNENSILTPYVGIGGGIYLVNESMKGNITYRYYSYLTNSYSTRSQYIDESGSENSIGLQFVAGLQINVVNIQAKYSYVSIKSRGVAENFGGFVLTAGLVF